jgi:hypothetical protein
MPKKTSSLPLSSSSSYTFNFKDTSTYLTALDTSDVIDEDGLE